MKERLSLFVLLLALLALSACRRSDRDKDNETQSASDNYLAEACWNDVFRQLDDAAAVTADVNRYSSGNMTAACYTVTVNPALPNPAFPKTVTVDFGSVNCTGPDGIARRGQITAVFSGRYRDSLTTITITTNNYYVNNYRVAGTKTITNQGHINGVATFSVNVQNAVITTPDNKTITWNSQRTRRWIAGEGTLGLVSDDVYEITGSANGRGTKGNTFTLTITTPLRVEMSCRWIVKGVIKLTPANLDDRIIDFGQGACDDQATVSIHGNSYTITLN
ncbi:MAG: hypothetical protein AB1458_10275 [Bacteroidota bacterium]